MLLFGTDDFDTAHVSSMIYYSGSGYVSKYTRINYPCPAHLAFVVYYIHFEVLSDLPCLQSPNGRVTI